jgi:hypothetical protein
MKKLATALLVTAIVSTPVFAKGTTEDLLTVCGYSDYFHLSDTSVKNIAITKLTGDEKVEVAYKVVSNTTGQNIEDKTSFYVSDTPTCVKNGGFAHVHYAKDKDNYCDLAVHDAENMFHPDITARCQGTMGYLGMEYDGFNTHSYSLTFKD